MSLDCFISDYTRFKSTYWQYKYDSDRVANWLATTAVRYGYPKDLANGADETLENAPKPGRLKGRARKLARDAAKSVQGSTSKDGKPSDEAKPQPLKYLIAVKEFTALAEWIASRKLPPKVPVSFVLTIERAIAARKKHCLMWDRGADPKEKGSSNSTQVFDGHAHFIGILESVRDTLKPLADLEDLPRRRNMVGKGLKDSHAPLDSCINKFGALDIDEPTSEFFQDDQITKSDVTEEKLDDRYAADTVGVLGEAHLAFGVIVADLDYMRLYLKFVWETYHDGKYSLIAASLVTDAAVDLARQFEEDYNQTFGAHVDLEKYMQATYATECILAGEDPKRTQKYNDMMNFAVWHRVERSLFPMWTQLAALQFHAKANPNGIVNHRPEKSMSFHNSSDDERKDPRDRFWKDKEILDLILPDISVFAFMGIPLPAEDRMTAGLREVFDTAKLSLSSVFAARIFLDIQEICEEKTSKGYEDLLSTADQVENNIMEMVQFHKELPIEDWPRELTSELQAILTDIKMWVNLDAGIYHRAKYWEHGGKDTSPSPRPFVFLKNHPWYCGLLSYNLQARAQAGALATINISGSVLYSAHLYNALRQEKLLSASWPDMHLALALNGTEELFIGKFPEKAGECHRRLLLALGYSASNFAKDCKPTSKLKKTRLGRRILNKISPVHKMFLARHTQNEDRLQFSKDDIGKLLALLDQQYKSVGKEQPLWFIPRATVKMSRRDVLPSSTIQTSSSITPWSDEASQEYVAFEDHVFSVEHTPAPTEASNGEGLYPSQLLAGIAIGILSETRDFAFNHFGFHVSAWQILHVVRNAVYDEIKAKVGSGVWFKEKNLPSLVEYILRVNAKDSGQGPRRKPAHERRATPILQLAAEAMQQILDEGIGHYELRRLQHYHGRNYTVPDPFPAIAEPTNSQNEGSQKVDSEDIEAEAMGSESMVGAKDSTSAKMSD